MTCSRNLYRVEDARYPIGLCEQSAVDDGESGADAEPLDGASEHHRLGQQSERVEVAEQDAAKQHKAQFSTRSLYMTQVYVILLRHRQRESKLKPVLRYCYYYRLQDPIAIVH